ncbi:MAG TPA: alpha/beta hydrolase [Caulobacteraceae bacterium]|nr:alpha/beta hydrolase [Caulobacteraceae bacterium]
MTRFTASDGVEIAFDDAGPREGRPVLLVHGFASNRYEGWKRTGWYAAFERRGQRVIAPDMRGHGESGKPHDPESYGRGRMAADLVELLDHLGVGSADVIGYSMGAGASLALALNHPGRVANLALGGVGASMFEPPRAPGAMAFAMEAENPDDIPVPLLRSFRQFAEEQGEDRLALAACVKAPSERPGPDSLYALRMPVLIVAGARDQLAGDPQALADLIPGAHAVSLPGCDHFNAIPHGLLKAAVFDFLDGMLDFPH